MEGGGGGEGEWGGGVGWRGEGTEAIPRHTVDLLLCQFLCFRLEKKEQIISKWL